MVMEATHSAAHSARSVGREFVRQYYTLLNQAPAHLHRFYNHNSAFIHGGLDNTDRDVIPAVGQKEIHQKIQELNFRDCHTRISQVDSQATLEDGVVIQVTGEFSNAGEPMRRFTQTFVLAARAPKTYYVLNDIFRYQDLGFPDEEVELETETSNEIAERTETEEGHEEIEIEEGQAPPVVNQTEHHIAQAPQQPQAPPQTQPAAIPPQMYYPPTTNQMIVVNGTIHDPEAMITQTQMMPIPQPAAQFVEPAPEFTQEEVPAEHQQSQPEQNNEETRNEENQDQQTDNFNQQPVNENDNEQNQSTGVNNKPKSYARTVRSNVIGNCNMIPKTMSPPPVSNVRNEERPIDVWNSTNTNMSSNVMTSGAGQPQHQQNRIQNPQPPQQQRPRVGPPQKDNRGGERRRDWPDSHQLFVGNVPHSATETELRIIFERFGKVADLRIFSKGNERSKGPQGSNNSMRVPHYGFVTFEDSNVVSKVLAACPICYPDENGQKLNIEEKKNKPRIPGDNMRNQDNMRSSMGPQQRGPGGPGVMRGGQHPRGGRGGFSRDGGRGGMRQPGMGNSGGYQNRR
ncbi:ras GTPase-activating protein-binding protein 1 [Microplitis demolitor]|uniref:ras GTPase-activating protein-binding protein 1 n=1 Tax=Microplitis demolitor TaxID=69319 RepID=UPI0004CCD2A5|nr:ras GTPase-activating protein-binding protein 1 [Microplitis demolitor]